MPKALSATVPEPLEARAREIARRENRSLSNVVENALGVFTALPKDSPYLSESSVILSPLTQKPSEQKVIDSTSTSTQSGSD